MNGCTCQRGARRSGRADMYDGQTDGRRSLRLPYGTRSEDLKLPSHLPERLRAVDDVNDGGRPRPNIFGSGTGLPIDRGESRILRYGLSLLSNQ